MLNPELRIIAVNDVSIHLWNKVHAELPLVERDSSAMKISHAVKPVSRVGGKRVRNNDREVLVYSDAVEHQVHRAEPGRALCYQPLKVDPLSLRFSSALIFGL